MARKKDPGRPKYTPRTQPRDPIGRYIRTDLKPGWYEYERGGEIHHYYLNEMNQLSDGHRMLTMGAQALPGNQSGKLDEQDAIERVHAVSSNDGELMYVSADENRTCGVIQHDTIAPPEPFSLSRYDLENKPVSENLPADDTAFGGRGAASHGRADGRTYDMLAAQEAESLNDAVFRNPDAHVCEADPAQLAQAAIAARHWYQENALKPDLDRHGRQKTNPDGTPKWRHMREDEARDQPVYVFVDGDRLRVAPAMRVVDGGKGLAAKGSPHPKRSGGTVKLTGRQLTRMAGALEYDGVKSCRFAITSGSNLSKNGTPLNNALQYRTTVTNGRSGRTSTMWGTVENHQKRVKPVEARNRFSDENGRVDPRRVIEYRREKTQEGRRRAERYHNPKDGGQASSLLHYRYGGYYAEQDITVGGDGTFTLDEPRRHQRTTFAPDGEQLRTEYTDGKGFLNYYNRGREPGAKITAARVVELPDGGYGIRQKRGQGILARYDRYGNRQGE